VVAIDGGLRSQFRGIEISPTGMVVDRGRRRRAVPLVQWLELYLPERLKPLRLLARPVWTEGAQQALTFVRISDADRLSLAEHLDLQRRRGLPLN
jgi:hypothetical protein